MNSVSRPAQPFQDGRSEGRQTFDRDVGSLKRRLVQEATAAVGMLEAALDALWKLDSVAAREVRRRDDSIDREEVEIEQQCLRLLALQQPFARDFRVITFILKVNNDVERVADHACSIAKITTRLESARSPKWPTALQEMGQRVPAMCHTTMRAILDENTALAGQIVGEDKTIDALEKRLFEETEQLMREDDSSLRAGLLIYRVGRELERIGDLMKNICEDVIYLATGSIVRHEAKRASQAAKA
ncbi:MAG: phosphate signaling complex protein PhoU [Phycisphaerales bacterium]